MKYLPPPVEDNLVEGITLIKVAVRHATWADWLSMLGLVLFVGLVAWARWDLEHEYLKDP